MKLLKVIDRWGVSHEVDTVKGQGRTVDFEFVNPNRLHFVKDLQDSISGKHYEVYLCKDDVFFLVYYTKEKSIFEVICDYPCVLDLDGSGVLDFSVELSESELDRKFRGKSKYTRESVRRFRDNVILTLKENGVITGGEIPQPHKTYLALLEKYNPRE